MPPYVPRKRTRTPSPARGVSETRSSKKGKTKIPPLKSSLFHDLEIGAKNRSAEKTKSALEQMHGGDDDDSSLSSLSSSDIDFDEADAAVQWEDVPSAKRQKLNTKIPDDEESDEEDVEFEDVPDHEPQADPVPSGDLELVLYQDAQPLSMDFGVKKGASKREKLIRNSTHCMHVQFLLFHNAIRNSWLCDQEVQAIMISHLPARLWEEVDRWRRNCGFEDDDVQNPSSESTRSGKTKANTRSKTKHSAAKPARDWSAAAERLEKGVPDLSHGDPLFRLMKSLCAWWKQRFKITAPGIRKYGYMGMRRLGKWRESFEKDEHDQEKNGERIGGLDEFRQLAQRCEGSRDVGAQLFTALLRGIGLEARMIANLQTLGFGWSKNEEADEEKPEQQSRTSGTVTPKGKQKSQPVTKKKPSAQPTRRGTRKSDRGALKMDLDDSDEYAEQLTDDSDDGNAAVVATGSSKTSNPSPASYDKDLEFPHYWTEVLSPVTQKYLPVDSIVKSVIGTNRELVESLEPRGAKADKAKQMMAYVVGYSQDGTAKDVTVRYLRKQIFPGKTKGLRMGIEKIPIYNKHGKVKRYDMFDWFKHAMNGYVRGDRKHPITEVDEVEDSTELKPAVAEKKEVKEGEETLQYYKSSKEYCLTRHLKREEALLPSAEPVKLFRNKAKGGKIEEENVYLRKDVVAVKSAETWHKQGRAPIPGEEPLKHAPYRAATNNRRREIAEAEARTGQKVLQPLYSFEQTDWIIPEPIKDGVIPKNEYGNIDMFAEHMCPEGAVHLPYRGAVRVCKRLQVDFAEAVVGFEFGHRMAVPVIQGVVVAEENQDRVLEEIAKDEVERARKEDEKRRKAALGMWRKLLMGLRIADRIHQEYGHIKDAEIPSHTEQKSGEQQPDEHDDDMAGGFFPDGHDEEEDSRHTSGYFPVAHEDDEDDPFEVEG
ncbi:Rad4 transglutaminase-like domain-containing protein [Xylariales sp. PMI_506]|nr:Rad4 transglutaminase-like domain-containing protein [Xylariales sp. PMI_506]